MGVNFNRLIFTIPTLDAAIKHEAYASDSIRFWRFLGADCLYAIQAVEDGKVLHNVPQDTFVWLGLKLFDYYLSTDNLRVVRDALREEIPTMPFYYNDVCFCDRKKQIPYTMETSAFFSE